MSQLEKLERMEERGGVGMRSAVKEARAKIYPG
jgi:hypothetical protein